MKNVYSRLIKLFHFSFLIFHFSLFTFAQSRTTGTGPGGRFDPIHSFQDDFLVYDEATKAYVPYILEQHADQTALSAFVDLESNRRYRLLISTQQDGYLFINAALKRKLRAGQWQVLSIDSLYRVYRTAEVFVTLYGAPGLADKQLLIAHPRSATQKPIILRDDNLSVRPRPISIYDDFLNGGLVFLLATHAFLFSFYRRAFLRFYNPLDLFSLRAQEESFLINRPLSSTNNLFVLNLSFVLAYLVIFVQSRNVDVFSSRTLLLGSQPFVALLGEFLFLTAVAFLALLGKYVALEVVGGLYRLSSVINIHYFKVLQASMLFFSGMTLVLATVAYNSLNTSWSESAILLPLIGFYLARLALLYLVIRVIEPIKNLYLFSYLCIVELVPLVIGLRFAL